MAETSGSPDIDLQQFKPIWLFISILFLGFLQKILDIVNYWFHSVLLKANGLIICEFMVKQISFPPHYKFNYTYLFSN